MCCCASPTVNGQPGYRWQPTDKPSTRPVDPPPLQEFDTLLFDEPGRCGGQDSHAYHYRVVSSGALLYRHGGGHGRIRLSGMPMVRAALEVLDSTARYWLLNAMYHAQADSASGARDATAAHWRTAAAEKRIKLRRRQGRVHVEIVPPVAPPPAEHL